MPTVVISALGAWRVVSRVDGILQEVLGLVGAELRDAGVREDNGVLELPSQALDLPHVDVLDGVAEVVEFYRTARRVRQVHAAEGSEELVRVLDVAARRLARRLGREPGDVRAFGVV